MRAGFIGLSALLGLGAAAVSGLILYEGIIVPLLPTVKSVPLWWWALADSPLWIAALCLGWQAGSIREAVAASLAGAVGSHAYVSWASLTNRPGFVNQPLAEVDPLRFWTVSLLINWLLLALPFAAGFMGKRLLAKRAANSSMQPPAFGRG